ncbi:MAG: glutathione S-transferase family protein [Pseudomonadota bacterium]
MMLKLLHFPLCPYSRKVRLALAEKELDVTSEAIEPWLYSNDLKTGNPAAEVPILEDRSRIISDSGVIVEYLEETQRGHTLIGKEPSQRAEIRRLMAWFDKKFTREVTDLIWYEKLIKRLRDKGTPDSAAVRRGLANIHEHLDYVGHLFDRHHWLAGDQMTLADITAAAHFSVLDYMGDVPWEKHPAAKLWYAKIKSRPSFRPLLADRLASIRPVSHYSDLDF